TYPVILPFARGESLQIGFGLANDRITVLGIDSVTSSRAFSKIFLSAGTCSLGFQASEKCNSHSRGHAYSHQPPYNSYLGLIEGVEVQPPARQHLPRTDQGRRR